MEGQGETTTGVPPRRSREKPRREYHHGRPGRNHEGSATIDGQGETMRGVPPWRARGKPRGSTTMMEGQGKTMRGVPPWRAREKPRGEDKFQGKSKRGKSGIR
jgi:hypothetical protein